MLKNTKKYMNHTKEEIKEYLDKIKKCVTKGKFTIPQSENRKENREFIEKYRLKSSKIRDMILNLDVVDFCYSVDDYNLVNEKMYIFAKEYELDEWGINNIVLVYIKFVLKNNDYVVVVSFYKANKEIKKLFI